MLLGVLLAGAVGITSVVTALWVEDSVSDISRTVETAGVVQGRVDAGKKEVEPPDSIPGSIREMVRARLDDRERWVDVF